MTFTPDMLRTIARNAGRVPKHNLANSLGISVSFLERLAREHGYDLRLVVEPPPTPGEPMSAHAAEHPNHRHTGAQRIGRSEPVQVRLFPADASAIDAAAHACGLRRGPAIARLIENARERGLIEELVRLPAPTPSATQGRESTEA